MKKNNPIWSGENAIDNLQYFMAKGDFSKLFFLVDENTHQHCLPSLLQEMEGELPPMEVLEIEPGEDSKSPEVLMQLWHALDDLEADRHSLLVNVGGGMITDLGGFLAGTFMRGISFINVPTSLLAMVDASNGGKTGINLDHRKNRIGLFLNPDGVLLSVCFLETLPLRERRSGFAEMLKHGLIMDSDYWQRLLQLNIDEECPSEELILHSVALKQKVIEQDFRENNLRKILNFGHTIGHAVETWFMDTKNSISHGEAVAWGMMAELQLSVQFAGLSQSEAEKALEQLKAIYGLPPKISPEAILTLMKMDKKNKNGQLYFSLLSKIGGAIPEVGVSDEAAKKVLQLFE